ncbi:MAG: hydrogenase 4 subunit F [Candidatus Methanoplasma sp.]|nr:hydrogenase 4 subunit F [Candidatus Methanoplasma sp.]
MSLEIELILLMPVAGALASLLSPGRIAALATSAASALALLFAAAACAGPLLDGPAIEYGPWYADGLSAVFLLLTCIVCLASSVYSYGYISEDRREGAVGHRDERRYYVMLNLFSAAMMAVCVVGSMGIMWIAIEVTTLISAFLVGFYKREADVEASWKYLMICSVGITLGLMGIVLMYASSAHILGESPDALEWPVLYGAAAGLDPTLMKMAFAFVIIGFGTKMGLVPMHTWLPDAHSQSPTPVSAMLSAALLNCALYAILRFLMITEIAVPGFASTILICFGALSLAAAGAFILISRDFKRMLAYSSIEHMGIIAIGFGIGSPLAVFGALIHVMAHSLTKPLMFFSAGNVIQGYGTRNMDEIRGLRKSMPFTAFMAAAGAAALGGMPPFSVFVGEATVIWGAVDSGMHALAAAMAVLLVLVFAGLTRSVLGMMRGDPGREVREPGGASRASAMAALLAATLALGLFMPDWLGDALRSIAEWFSGGAR